MRNLLLGLVVVGLLAAPSLAIVNVQLSSDKAAVDVGETAVVTVKVSAPAGVGVSALAGSINATGTGSLTASGFAFASAFNRPAPNDFVSVVGAAAANGGWASFGSGQVSQLMNQATATYGAGTLVTFATYTVTGTTAGDVTLTFAKAEVGGFLLVSTDKSEVAGTNTAVTITVNSTGPTGCWGDIDESMFVDGDDLAILAYAWMQGPEDAQWYAPADLDGSGFVDGDDLGILAYGWLDCIPME